AAAVALTATLASIAYTVLAISRLRAFARPPAARSVRRPGITILKPVRGVEPLLAENLRSFCAQAYPEFQVVFGVLDPGDPALEIIRAVAAEHADRTTVVAGNGVAEHRNPKISTLAPMLAHAKYGILAISDSDMRVGPSYLDAVAAAFDDERVGAVTCTYRGEPADDRLASRLGAMGIGEQFVPSALVAIAIEPLTFCFGATMAVRRGVLDAVGGLRAIGTHLADDFAMGHLVSEHGLRVAFAPYAVTNTVSEPGMRALFSHELRWLRTIRSVRPKSYAGIILTYPVPLALLYAALAPDRGQALPVAALAVLVRLALHREAHRSIGTQRPPALWLIPLRDALGVVVWICGSFGRGVRWRGTKFEIATGGDTLKT
ncbi:MAG: bacteriohopanetetrol glucosamine biosynthesis glycosyltransferase HpnI, partial [Candidatus Eremiobacteraeota bacterium]|nr:bacteriohopanetetrol glucosamine biosynthesis glycosyltransferase HpnI [Candidatus Eremiobacteraeota bacterium]